MDDKIELNRRRCKTLEAMARAIFKSWFVDFDPVKAKAAVRKEHPRWTDEQVSRAACPKLKPEIAALFPDAFEDSPLGPIPQPAGAPLADASATGLLTGNSSDRGQDSLQKTSTQARHTIALEHMPRRSMHSGRLVYRGPAIESQKFEFVTAETSCLQSCGLTFHQGSRDCSALRLVSVQPPTFWSSFQSSQT
ncbi:MAG: hypothetical protein KatS3mg015_2961 [Fimbriimonadales bacterium]|nr:MAG: hypothetical protein KatS3mg015_2961 [Fimbriimonadales bacterium]